MDEAVTIHIARLGAQGDGIGTLADGRQVFVPYALPGERVRVALSPGTDRGALLAVELASADRVPPICPHFTRCGGCAIQHLGAARYLAWKRDLVATAFTQRGLEAPLAPIIAIPHASRRRTTLAAQRTAQGVIVGYHPAGSHEVVPVAACPLLVPALARLLPRVPEIVGPLLQAGDAADVTLTATTGGGDMTVTGTRRSSATARAAAARAAESAGLDRLTVERELVSQVRPPAVHIAGVDVPLPPSAFLQASEAAEEALRGLVVAAVGKARRVADLFAGLGTFTYALGRRAEVLAVEGDAAHVAALAQAAKGAKGLKPLKTLRRDLFRDPMSARELKDFDAVVVDPPRAGAKAQAEALAASAVPVIVMVSCNPATLARDVRTLVDGGYTLEQVTPVDQFVFSHHVEAVAVVRRGKVR